MKKKSEAAKVIRQRIKKLEMDFGKSVKRYHPDNAKEQRTKKLLNELKAKAQKYPQLPLTALSKTQ